MGTLTPPLYTVVMVAKVKFHFVVLFQSSNVQRASHDLPFGHWNKFRFSEDDLIMIACGDMILYCKITGRVKTLPYIEFHHNRTINANSPIRRQVKGRVALFCNTSLF